MATRSKLHWQSLTVFCLRWHARSSRLVVDSRPTLSIDPLWPWFSCCSQLSSWILALFGSGIPWIGPLLHLAVRWPNFLIPLVLIRRFCPSHTIKQPCHSVLWSHSCSRWNLPSFSIVPIWSPLHLFWASWQRCNSSWPCFCYRYTIAKFVWDCR